MKNYLEYEVNKLIRFINENNIGFGFKLNPNRNHKGVYIEGECWDYCIKTKDKLFCFDAKQTNKQNWNIKQKDKKQLLNLYKIQQFNCQCFFLIYFFSEKKLKMIDVDNVLKIIRCRQHIKNEDCKNFDFDIFKKE